MIRLELGKQGRNKLTDLGGSMGVCSALTTNNFISTDSAPSISQKEKKGKRGFPLIPILECITLTLFSELKLKLF